MAVEHVVRHRRATPTAAVTLEKVLPVVTDNQLAAATLAVALCAAVPVHDVRPKRV
jgi:hypothetical protein